MLASTTMTSRDHFVGEINLLALQIVFVLLANYYYYCYYYTVGNTPYVNRSEAMNRRRGWSSLIGGHPAKYWPPSVVCSVSACVLLFLVFVIAVHLGNKTAFYPLSPLTSQVTVFLQCRTDHNVSTSVPPDCIDSRLWISEIPPQVGRKIHYHWLTLVSWHK